MRSIPERLISEIPRRPVTTSKKNLALGEVFCFGAAQGIYGSSTKSITWMMPLLARISGATMVTELLFALTMRLP